MGSIYASKGRTGGSVYAQKGVTGGSVYAGRSNGGSSAAPPKKKHHSFLGHLVGQTAKDFYNAAVQSPAGAYTTVKAIETDYLHGLRHGDINPASVFVHGKNTKALEKQTAESTAGTLRHPLRHPGLTILTVVPLVGTAARAGLAGSAAARAAAAGDVTGAGKALVKRPDFGPRELKSGDVTLARGHYSRSTGAAVIQKGVDTALQKAATKSVRAENLLHRRAAKWNERTLTVQEAKARQAGTRLQAVGKKLTPIEQRALRLVAEETPVARRLGAQEMRKARAKGKEIARHQERIDLTRDAMQFLDEGPNGRPVFKPSAVKLQKVYGLLKAASADRESMLKQLDLMDHEALQAAKTKTARVAAGGTFAKATLGERLAQTPERFHPHFVEGLVGRYVKAADRSNYGRVLSIDTEKGTARVYFKNKQEGSQAAVELPLDQLTNPRGKAGRIKGAEDITVSPDAVHIGNPVERTKLRGRPKTSSTGTFGHTSKPSSLKQATGGAVEHALERNDVTNIVAERHAEAVRLSQIHRRVDLVKKAGEASPRRKDDVFVWTDRTVSNERIPAEVRRYLDHPESVARLPHAEQESVLDQIKAATLERHDWQADPESLAEFEKYAREGKGVFVPRRLLGNAAKPSPNINAIPGIKAVDAVNNAQKAALVYLKVNYPIIQGFSNAAMGLIQQGFAYPLHLKNAVRLSHAAGPETAAAVDDIMGQGAVVQASFQGEGAISRASQAVGRTMSHGVDTPARRAAFLYEAAKAGFGSPEKLRALLEDEANAHTLGEVAQRAKEAIVDYGELSPTERALIRRLVFVYPWQKGAVKYAGHFLRDHPVQAAAVGALGAIGAKANQEKLGPVPSYLQGSFDVGGRLVNPAGVNFFQTPGQTGAAIGGYLTGNQAAPTGQDFLAPFPALAVALLTKRDSLGRPLTGNIGSKLEKTLVEPSPAAMLIRALTGTGHPSKTFPNPNDPLYRFLLGGLYPRQYSRPALNRNAALEKTGR